MEESRLGSASRRALDRSALIQEPLINGPWSKSLGCKKIEMMYDVDGFWIVVTCLKSTVLFVIVLLSQWKNCRRHTKDICLNRWRVVGPGIIRMVWVCQLTVFLCLFVCLTICLHACLAVCLSVCLFACVFVCPPYCLFIFLSASLSVSLCVLSACLSHLVWLHGCFPVSTA